MNRAVLVVMGVVVGCPSLPRAPGDLSVPEGFRMDALANEEYGGADGRDTAIGDSRDRKDEIAGGDLTCVPQCWGRVCGPDGCGGVCGVCPDGTVCSFDNSMCVSTSVQKALGGPCGPTEGCLPRLHYPGGSYPNPKWPGCMHDQCLEGPCVAGFCSRKCRMMQDIRVNGTDLFAADGIEDPDSPLTDCKGGRTDLFDQGFACVLVEPGATQGLCYPKASFRPCDGPQDCPDKEACGLLVVLGNLEKRCVAVPFGAGKIAEACGYDPLTGMARRCEAWACSADGCTNPCSSDNDCLTPGARCEPISGMCSTAASRCEGDGDCSAWVCRSDVFVEELGLTVQACGPRECDSDNDCQDAGFYCLHKVVPTGPGKVSFIGKCVPRETSGQALGGQCDDTPGDGRPDVVCQDRAYCLDGRCGAMCTSDEDCALPLDGARSVPAMVCAQREFAGEGKIEAPVPVCTWFGEPGAPCEVQAQCEAGVCTPWIPVATGMVSLHCMEPPLGSLGIGNFCGEKAWGQTCDTRVCLGESGLAPGVCSTVCRDAGDCPVMTPIGTEMARFVCEAVPFFRAGTVYLGDDEYVSWCLPVPGKSTLAPCEPVGFCPDEGETCRGVIRSGAPGGLNRVEYRCIRAESGGEVGAACDPEGDGTSCRSGVCAPTTVRGVGFCTTVCDSDQTCLGFFGNAARCVKRAVIWRETPSDRVTVRECRIVETCVPCRDDRDCPDENLRCADVATLPYQNDYRCAPTCASDADCAVWGMGLTCTEVDAPLETSKTGKVRVCSPMVCP